MPSNELAQARRDLDELNLQILRLIEARVEVAKQVSKLKKEHGLKLKDLQREQEMFSQLFKDSCLSESDIRSIFTEIFAVSFRRMEEGL